MESNDRFAWAQSDPLQKVTERGKTRQYAFTMSAKKKKKKDEALNFGQAGFN